MRRDPLWPFLQRERKQGAHLARALLGHHQREFGTPAVELRRLSRRAASDLGSFNPYARRWWLLALVRNLPPVVHAHNRLFGAPDVFLLTIIDKKMRWFPDGDGPMRVKTPKLTDVRSAYLKHLAGLNAIGMVDAGFFVSARRFFNVDRFIHLHLHAVVWGVDEVTLRARCEDIRGKIFALTPYTTAAAFTPICHGDLRQVLWYSTKTARKQHQVHIKDSGRPRHFKRAINGVNAVRLYAALGRTPLDQLTLASGQGADVRAGMLRDLQRWRDRRSWGRMRVGTAGGTPRE